MSFIDSVWEWLNRLWARPAVDEVFPGEIVGNTASATMFKIENHAPGVVLSYLIRHQDGPQDLLFNLVSLAALKEDFARGAELRRRTDPFYLVREREFDEQVEEFLTEYGWLNRVHISHVVVLAFKSRKTYRKDRRDGWVLYPIAAIPGDLQNFHLNPGDRYASWVLLEMARIALKKTPTPYVTWRQIIVAYPWQRAAEALSRKTLGSTHIFQPKLPSAPPTNPPA